jgi:class 3 adenylate cyclase
MASSPQPTPTKRARPKRGSISWTDRRKSFVDDLKRENILSKEEESIKGLFHPSHGDDKTEDFLRTSEDWDGPTKHQTEEVSIEGFDSRKRSATTAAALQSVAGWSSVKNLERYVPGVVMSEIIDNILHPESQAFQSPPKKPLVVARANTGRQRRKSLKLASSEKAMQVGTDAHKKMGEKVREEENCTVVLADISGFTTLAEKLSKLPDGRGTEELSSKLNNYFGKMIDMIYEGGGDVVKFAGDALLVVWRQHEESEDAVSSFKVKRKATEHKGTNHTLFSPNVGAGRKKRNSMMEYSFKGRKGMIAKEKQSRNAEELQECVNSSTVNVPSPEKSLKRMQSAIDVTDTTDTLSGLPNNNLFHSKSWRSQMNEWRKEQDSSPGFLRQSTTSLSRRADSTRFRSSSEISNDYSALKRMSSDSRYSGVESSSPDIGEKNCNSKDRVSTLKKYVGDHSRSSNSIHTMYIKQMAQAKQNAAHETIPKTTSTVQIGPEVVDFIEMIREHVKLKKVSPAEYVRLVNQRLEMFKDGLLDGMAETISMIRSRKDLEKESISTKPNAGGNTGLRTLLHAMLKGVSVRERRHYFRHYPRCFVAEEAVIWLCQNGYCSSVDEAVATGNMLLAAEHIKKLTSTSDSNFHNNGDFYSSCDKSAASPGLAKRKLVKAKTVGNADANVSIFGKMKGILRRGGTSGTTMNGRSKTKGHLTHNTASTRATPKSPSSKSRHTINPIGSVDYRNKVEISQPVFRPSRFSSVGCRTDYGANDPSSAHLIHDSTYAAVHTCLRMCEELDGIEGLRLHVGIGMGKTLFMHVGGVLNRYEFVMAGEALVKMSQAEDHAKAGDLCVSGEVWDHVKGLCYGHPSVKSMSETSHEREGETTPVHLVVGTKVEPSLRPSKRRWETWEQERHYRLKEMYNPDLPLVLCDRLVHYIPGTVRDVLTKLHMDAFRTLSLSKATNTAVKYDKARLFQFRQVSVLFVNLPGIDYSANSSEILKILQGALTCMQACLFELEGSLRQFIMDDKGTTLIGVFGLYPAHDNDAYLAVKCALNIVRKLHAEMHIKAKVGVTTGTVFAAEVGNDRRCEYAVIGDVVNMAARLMVATSKVGAQIGEEVSVMCDEATYLPIVSKFRFKRLKPIHVKGKVDEIRIFSPLIERSGHSKRSKKRLTPYFGRDLEQTILLDFLDPVINREQKERVVVVTGAAGVGKSRFVDEFTDLCEDLLLTDVYVCKSISNGANKYLPFHAFQRFFAHVVAQWNARGIDLLKSSEELGSPSVKLDRFPGMATVWEKRHFLKRLLKGKGRKPKAKVGDAQSCDDSVDSELVDFLCELTHASLRTENFFHMITVFYIEHLDNCDIESVILFEKIGKLCYDSKMPMLMITTRRTYLSSHSENDSLRRITNGAASEEVVLEPFGVNETRDFIVTHLRVDTQISEIISDQIFARTGGNALYIEELLQSLISSDTLVVENGVCRFNELVSAAESHALPVPETMKGVYQQNIDRLDNDQLWVLTIASALGIENQEFSTDDLLAVYVLTEAKEKCEVVRSTDDSEQRDPEIHLKAAPSDTQVQYFYLLLGHLIAENLLVLTDERFLSFHRLELMEVVYGKSSFSVRRRIHAMIAVYLTDYSMGVKPELAKSQIPEARRSRKQMLPGDASIDLANAQKWTLIGNHYARAMNQISAFAWLMKALVCYKRLYAYPHVIDITKKLLGLLASNDDLGLLSEEGVVDAVKEKEEKRRLTVSLKSSLGEIYLKIGKLDQAYPLLNDSMMMCGVNPNSLQPIPKSEGQFALVKSLSEWEKTKMTSVMPHKNSDFRLIFESGSILYALASHHLATSSLVMGIPPLIKAVHLGLVPQGVSPLLARTFALCGMYAWTYFFDSKLADRFFAAALRIESEVYDVPTVATVTRLHAQYTLYTGLLNKSITQSSTASRICSHAGLADDASFLAAKKLEGDGHFYRGHISDALSCYETALNLLSDTKTFSQLWNEVGRGQCLLHMVDRGLEFEATIKMCNSFIEAFSSKALRILAGSNIVAIKSLTLLHHVRHPGLIKKLSIRQLDGVAEDLTAVTSFNSAVALVQLIEVYLGIAEAMLITELTRSEQTVSHKFADGKGMRRLVRLRMRIVFGLGFLVPHATKYLSHVYPIEERHLVMNKIYSHLKVLSGGTRVFRILIPSYKRLSGIFHALEGRHRLAATKWKQAAGEASKQNMDLEEILIALASIRYSEDSKNADVSKKMKEYSVRLNDLGATAIAKTAEFEGILRSRGDDYVASLFGLSMFWKNIEKVKSLTEMEELLFSVQ